MNEAVKTMSDLLTENYCKTIVIGGKVFVIKAPAIKVILRATRYFAFVDIPTDVSMGEMLKVVSENTEKIIKGLSYLVIGDVGDFELQSKRVVEELSSGTYEELCSAFLVAFNLLTGKELFQCASLAMELANLIVKPKS